MSNTVSPWLRGSLLLFCVAVIGALIGTGWEMSGASGEERFDAEVENDAPESDLPRSPRGPGTFSESERQVIRRATSELPPYPRAVPRAMAADYLAPGSPIAVAWFATSDTPDQVLGFYHQAILDAGLPAMQHWYNPNAGYVGHVNPATQETHLVSVLAQGGETLVFVSSGQVDSFLEGQTPLPQELPMPEGASPPVVLTFHEEGRVRYSVQADVPHLRAAELASFYRATFGNQGWTVQEVEQSTEGTHLMASRGAHRISALVKPSSPGALVLLTLDAQEQVQ
ncbi:hypothetical protein [Hyalangium minutum]|uniref:Uncharacterized protein n=1 Tax=Hyalangium minutum TaxID=394096 RepID=A0A085WMP5_9BACT|nr:hypothetical protein [Hyalangium minutum]KFE68958.1 hypothetical protein DB31_6860 [Hyalangium minutum]